jgi:RNA recognition motif-containing protein
MYEASFLVRHLGTDVSEDILLAIFQLQYPSCRSAKIVLNPSTGQSLRYAIVRFGNEMERQHALSEMRCAKCGNKRILFKTVIRQIGSAENYNGATDPENTTVFVSGLTWNFTANDLEHFFDAIGQILFIRIPIGRGYAFVVFTNRYAAEKAIDEFHGISLGGASVSLCWARRRFIISTPIGSDDATVDMQHKH